MHVKGTQINRLNEMGLLSTQNKCATDGYGNIIIVDLVCPSAILYNGDQDVLNKPGPEVIKLFSYSIQLSTNLILLINVKMPTIVGILTLISKINTTSERHKASDFFLCRYFSFYKQLKFRAQLTLSFKTSGTVFA